MILEIDDYLMILGIDDYFTDEGKVSCLIRVLFKIQLISGEEAERAIDELQIRLFNKGG